MPAGDGWIHEYKYDGYRLLLAVGDGVATAWTRNGKDWSDKFKALVKAAAKLPAGCLIDGEAVAIDDEGSPSFQLLQSTLKDQKGANLAFYAFDLLIDRGEDIRKLPNIERKERLAALLEGVPPPILYGDHVIGRGEELFARSASRAARASSRRRPSAPYSGTRTPQLAQDQVHPAPGIRDRRLVGKRQAPRLPLAASGGEGEAASSPMPARSAPASTRKLIEELMERMEPLEIDKAAGRGPARRPQGRALDQAEARRRNRLQ